jgi:predicted dinucleotide-binding enzyme
VRVVSAFQNVSAHKLKKLGQTIDCDILVAADEMSARAVAIAIANDGGMRGINVGPLANSVVAESLTSADLN